MYGYIAGFIDADGCLTTYEENHGWRPSVQAYSKDRRGLIILKNEFGGGIYPVQQTHGWNWSLYVVPYISIMLKSILPHLILKEKQARLMIKLCSVAAHLEYRKPDPRFIQERRRLAHLIREANQETGEETWVLDLWEHIRLSPRKLKNK